MNYIMEKSTSKKKDMFQHAFLLPNKKKGFPAKLLDIP